MDPEWNGGRLFQHPDPAHPCEFSGQPERIVTSTAGIDMTEPIRPVIQHVFAAACYAPLWPLTPKSDQQDWAMSKLFVGRIAIALQEPAR